VNDARAAGPLIAIADDHPLVRAALRDTLRSLEPPPRFLEGGDIAAAMTLATSEPGPDLLLMDLAMPGSHGLDDVRALRQTAPALPIVVVSADENPGTVGALVAMGVAGFIPKSEPAEVIRQAVQLVLAGGTYVPVRYVGAPLAAAPSHAGLTERQVDVLRLLARGRSNKEIARELGITEGTVKVHLLSVFRLLGVRNRTEAVLAAQRFL
jgi:DNA-binding NarL/FixJ family response regulator